MGKKRNRQRKNGEIKEEKPVRQRRCARRLWKQNRWNHPSVSGERGERWRERRSALREGKVKESPTCLSLSPRFAYISSVSFFLTSPTIRFLLFHPRWAHANRESANPAQSRLATVAQYFVKSCNFAFVYLLRFVISYFFPADYSWHWQGPVFFLMSLFARWTDIDRYVAVLNVMQWIKNILNIYFIFY